MKVMFSFQKLDVAKNIYIERKNTTYRKSFDVKQVKCGGSWGVESKAIQSGVKGRYRSCTHAAGPPFWEILAPQGHLGREESGQG